MTDHMILFYLIKMYEYKHISDCKLVSSHYVSCVRIGEQEMLTEYNMLTWTGLHQTINFYFAITVPFF